MDRFGRQQAIRRELDPSVREDPDTAFVKNCFAVDIAVDDGVLIFLLEKLGEIEVDGRLG
ncbi:hypothetical protein JCM18750_33750 [Halostagnicola bangensis]